MTDKFAVMPAGIPADWEIHCIRPQPAAVTLAMKKTAEDEARRLTELSERILKYGEIMSLRPWGENIPGASFDLYSAYELLVCRSNVFSAFATRCENEIKEREKIEKEYWKRMMEEPIGHRHVSEEDPPLILYQCWSDD